jgi:hypothetical protein
MTARKRRSDTTSTRPSADSLPDSSTPVEMERARCLRCVESLVGFSEATDSVLIRIANQIRSGAEPLTMDEQMRPEE